MERKFSADEALRVVTEGTSEPEDFFSSDTSDYSDEDFVPDSLAEGGQTEEDMQEDLGDDNVQDDVEEDVSGQNLWRSKNKKIIWSPTREVAGHFVPPTLTKPGPTSYAIARISSPVDAFTLFFTDDIIDHIVAMTNLQGPRTAMRWSTITAQQLRAYFGLLILAGVYKSKDESLQNLWDKELGRPIFAATMSIFQFGLINRALRFDDKLHRPQRHHMSKLAPIQDVWIKWNSRLQMMFYPGRDICVDKQLLSFRGSCPFKQYIPSNSANYGLRVWTACDVATSYALNLEVCTGRPSGDRREPNVGMGVVLRLCSNLNGHTVTMDKCFTSFPLAAELE